MGSPSGSGTSSTPSNSVAQFYQPQGQPLADVNTQNIQNALAGQGLSALNYFGQSPYQSYFPASSGLLGQYVVDPTTGALPQSALNAIFGSQQAAAEGLPLFNLGTGASSSLGNYASGLLNYAPTLSGYSNNLGTSAGNVLNTAFDPQSALYNRTAQQTTDQQNAINALSGTAASPYGAGLTGQDLSNFNINWQNNLLNRETSGLGSAGAGYAGAANLLGAIGNLGSQYGALNTTAGQLGLGGANALNTLSGLPYQTGVGAANTGLGGLTNLANFANQAYQLPQTTLTDLGNYLKLGQNASLGSGQLGNLGYNQLSSGIGGALSGANTLFNPNSGLLSSGSGGALSGLFGSGASDTASLGGDFGGAIDLSTGAAPTISAVSGDAGSGLFGSLGLGALGS